MVELIINQPYHVLVRLPKASDRKFDTWASVRIVFANTQNEAIDTAVRETPVLAEYVPEGRMTFIAIPMKSVPIKVCSVFGQEMVPT